MSTFQTLTSLVVLIFVLSVIVQAVQEFVKSVFGTKANVMEQTIEKFMGNALTLPQVQTALQKRGLDITALESFSKDDFRHLLDGIPFAPAQLQGVVAHVEGQAEATVAEIKNNIAGSYEAARAKFQADYTRRNKYWVLGLSIVVVLLLNANIITLYDAIAADQAAQQSITGQVEALIKSQPATSASGTPQTLQDTYTLSRNSIHNDLKSFPILLRTSYYKDDFQKDSAIRFWGGLLIMFFLVSLGAPFWNDILKSMMGVNSALNTSAKKTA